MNEFTITGKDSLRRAIALARWLKSNGYSHETDWDWQYRPSQEDDYKRIDFWVKDPQLASLLLLLDSKAPL